MFLFVSCKVYFKRYQGWLYESKEAFSEDDRDNGEITDYRHFTLESSPRQISGWKLTKTVVLEGSWFVTHWQDLELGNHRGMLCMRP